jgi:hypothetical protein
MGLIISSETSVTTYKDVLGHIAQDWHLHRLENLRSHMIMVMMMITRMLYLTAGADKILPPFVLWCFLSLNQMIPSVLFQASYCCVFIQIWAVSGIIVFRDVVYVTWRTA